MTNVSIGGNVTDSVMVFGNDNYVVKIGDVNGGVVNIIKPSDKPKFSARPAPIVIKPRTFHSLLDRKNEFESIKKASQLSVPVSLWGQSGIGKTSFIRYLAHTLDAGRFTSGVVFLDASGLGYEDILQALFDLFFDSDASYKPTTADIVQALQNIKALIFLDDIQIGRDEAPSILDAAPQSLFILSSIERSLWGEGEIIPLRGLPESESLKLFEKELSRSLSDSEKTTFTKICSMLQGHPLQILQAASLARDSGSSMENLLSGIAKEKTENKSMAYMSMAYLSDSEKQILALLAAAGGNTVSLEHIKGIFKDGKGQNDIQRLVTLGLVQAHSPRFSITSTLVSSISATWDITSWQDILLNYAINWLSQQPASALVEESSGLLIHTIKSAGERKKWREVIQLGRALEKFMIFYKRWQTWSDILNLILTAAKSLNDSQIQAWALHQLGSRALYLGNASEAKTFLSQALNIRQAIGDKAGLAITQHNINILNGIIAPLKGNASGCKKYSTCGCGAVAAITALAVMAGIIIYFLLPPRPPVIQPPDTPIPAIPSTEAPVIVHPTDTPTPVSTITITPTHIVTLTSIPHTLTATSIPTPLGGSGQLAFKSQPDPLGESFFILYTMNVADSKPRETLPDFIAAQEPAWSPDGRIIAFVHRDNPNGFNQIYFVNADGSDMRQVAVGDQGDKSHPTWSPDGKRIAFLLNYPSGGSDLYAMNTDSGEFTNLTNSDGTGIFDYPEWSPDGKRMAYHAFVENNWELFVMDSDGANQTRLTYAQNQKDDWSIQPTWSPNGKQIAFASNRSSAWDIYVMNADGSKVRSLTQDKFTDIMPDWSPDGRLIAFSSDRDGILQIYVMTNDGSGITRLTDMPGNTEDIDWRP